MLTFVAADENSSLFEKVHLSPDAKDSSIVNPEDIKVEDIEDTTVKEDVEDEESKLEDVTETTLTKDETEDDDTDTMAAAEINEEKYEKDAINNVQVKTYV